MLEPIKNKIGSQNWLRFLLLIGIVGVCLMLGSSWWSKGNTKTTPEKDKNNLAVLTSASGDLKKLDALASGIITEEEKLEQRLGSVLQQINGVGSVKVAITLVSGTRYEYATNLKNNQREVEERDERGGTRATSERTQDEQLVLLSSGGANSGQPLVIREIKPEIKGVLVVAEGAQDARIREQLTRTLQSVLGVPAYKIRVMPGTVEGR